MNAISEILNRDYTIFATPESIDGLKREHGDEWQNQLNESVQFILDVRNRSNARHGTRGRVIVPREFVPHVYDSVWESESFQAVGCVEG